LRQARGSAIRGGPFSPRKEMGKMRGDGKAKSRGWVGGVDGGKAGLREGSLGKEDKRVAASAKVRRGWERTMVMAMSDER